MEAPRQKLMNESATVVATTTFRLVLERSLELKLAMLGGTITSGIILRSETMAHPDAATMARAIATQLRARGHQAYLVGGCVRDLLLGREPGDFDIATSARPGELLALFPGSLAAGAKFGVILVPVNGFAVEVSTFRSDGAYLDGRRPVDVHFENTPQDDVGRRDFTINGLLMDPETNEVIDLVGGREDLRAGLVRAIGDPRHRFEEDHLRMLRAVRFAARLGFEIEAGTFAAIRESGAAIERIAVERVRSEIERILIEGGARRGMELLDSTGLLDHILPEVSALQGVAQPPEYHPEGDVWTHTLLMLEGLRSPSLELALGVLFHDIGKPATFRIDGRIRFDGHVEAGVKIARAALGRLRFSEATIRQVEALVANHMRFMHVQEMRESTLRRFFRLEHFDEHLELHRLDCSSSHGDLRSYEFARARYAAMPPEVRQPPRLVTGEDLIAAGYLPGPGFRQMLEAVEDAQLEGRLLSRADALEFLDREFGPPGHHGN